MKKSSSRPASLAGAPGSAAFAGFTGPDSFKGAGSHGLPSFTECEIAVDAGNPTPLERLIYNHEPGDESEESFRSNLAAALRACLPNIEHDRTRRTDGN